MSELKHIDIYTDGACSGNPGPGGYGIVILSGTTRRELSGGYKLTTNNRMELMAVILGLEAVKEQSSITIYSDSSYVVNAMTKGWALRWKQNRWMRNKKEKALNPDLWERLLKLCERHRVTFVWVKGHSSNKENARCDQLATQALREPNLTADTDYVTNTGDAPRLF